MITPTLTDLAVLCAPAALVPVLTSPSARAVVAAVRLRRARWRAVRVTRWIRCRVATPVTGPASRSPITAPAPRVIVRGRAGVGGPVTAARVARPRLVPTGTV